MRLMIKFFLSNCFFLSASIYKKKNMYCQIHYIGCIHGPICTSKRSQIYLFSNKVILVHSIAVILGNPKHPNSPCCIEQNECLLLSLHESSIFCLHNKTTSVCHKNFFLQSSNKYGTDTKHRAGQSSVVRRTHTALSGKMLPFFDPYYWMFVLCRV